MIPALLAAAIGTVGTLPAPSQHVHDELHGIGIEIFVEVGPTHFKAMNPSAYEYLLVFGTPESGILGRTVLHAGTSIGHEFPEGALDGLNMDVLALHDGVLLNTGGLPLGELANQGGASIWLQASPTQLFAWLVLPEGFDLLSPSGHILPQRVGSTLANTDPSTGAEPQGAETNLMHVPVIDPEEEEPEEEGPPVIEDKPLPPI